MKVGAAFTQTLGSQLLQSTASVATGVLVARGLGPSGQGRYATFAAGVALGALFASLGQFHGNVLAAADRQSSPRVLLARATIHALVVVSALTTLTLAGGDALGVKGLGLPVLFVLILGLEALADMVRGINLGQHHVTGWNIASLTQRIAYLCGVVTLTMRSHLDLQSVLECWATATFVSIVVSGTWVWVHSPAQRIDLKGMWTGWGGRLSQGMRAFVTIGFTLLLVRADVWMLRPMLGVATVGQVSVATYLAEWMWYVPSILGNLLFAVVARDRGPESIRRVARSARLVTALLVPVGVVLIGGGRLLVHLMYGNPYDEAGILFSLLVPGMTALGIHLVVDSFFAGSGFPPVTYFGALGALTAKALLNLLVVPHFGAEGAAAVTSLVYIGLLGLKVVWFRRVTGTGFKDLLLVNSSDVAYIGGRLQLLLIDRKI